MRMISRILLFGLMLTLVGSGYSQEGAERSFAEGIQRLIQKYDLKESRIGISLYSMKEARTIYTLHHEEMFVIASNTKLFTTAAALIRLTPTYQFETHLMHTGSVDGAGNLNGDLIVIGSGDPNISGRFHHGDPTALFRKWAKCLKQQGIQKVLGDLILDQSVFDEQFVHPNWDRSDLLHWWAAPVNGLPFNDNCIDITVKGNAPVGGLASYHLSPNSTFMKVINRVRVGKQKSQSGVSYRMGSPGEVILTGTIPYTQATSFSVPVRRPTSYFGFVFRETLARSGISVHGNMMLNASYDREQAQSIDIIRSGLIETLTIANRNSQNLYAESVLKRVGRTIRGRGSFHDGTAAVVDLLGSRKIQGMTLVDGSGLSRKNRATPTQITDLLIMMKKHQWAKEFVATLAVSGAEKGTLRKRMRRGPLKGVVQGKSGHLTGVTVLSGYLNTTGDDIIVFSILLNELPRRRYRGDRFQEAVLSLCLKGFR